MLLNHELKMDKGRVMGPHQVKPVQDKKREIWRKPSSFTKATIGYGIHEIPIINPS